MFTKILSSPLRILKWICRNPAEMMLLSIFIFSFLPFFMHIGSPAMLGGFLSFSSFIAWNYVFKGRPSRLFNTILLIVLIMGVISILTLEGKDYNSTWTPTEDFLSTYLGAFIGVMMASFLISLIENEREQNKKRKEIDRINFERQQEAKMIAQKEQEGYIAIKREGKLIGYIPTDKYDGFVNMNLITK